MDSAGGIYHMGARFYDPALGRWLSADTIVPDPTNPQSLNRYSYTRNNPVKYRDPSGRMEIYGGNPHQPASAYWHTYVNPRAPGCQSDLKWIDQATSLTVDFIPVVGDAKGLVEVATGKDLITGEDLGAWRWAGLFGLVGLAEIRQLRHADDAIGMIKSMSRTDLEWLGIFADTTENHHWIPQQFHPELGELYGEVAATTLHFTEPLETGFHKLLHGKSGILANAYNARIASWLDEFGSSKTWEDFVEFIGELREEYLTLYEGYLPPVDD